MIGYNEHNMKKLSTFIPFLIVYLVILLILVGCSQNGNKVNSTAKKHLADSSRSNDDFNTFFNRFKTDSAFQKAHIHFPLKYKTLGDESGVDSMKLIASGEWTFARLFISNGKKLILRRLKTTSTETDIQVQIEDTGFENEFTFLKDNNNWFLVSITDYSD